MNLLYNGIVIFLFITIIIILMLIIRKFYFKCFKNNKVINSGAQIIDNIKNNNDIIVNQFLTQQEKIMNSFNSNKNIVQQYECIFEKDEPFKLISVSDTFLDLLGMNSFDDLIQYYNKNKNEDDINKSLFFSDLFFVNKTQYNRVVDTLKETGTISDNNLKIELNSYIRGINIKLIYDLFIDENNRMIMRFDIYRITPKKSFRIESATNASSYSDLIHNIVIDLQFPIIIVNLNGIKFINKCACDWFNLPYFDAINQSNKNNNIINLDDIFKYIDYKLVDVIKDLLKNNDSNGYYREYYLDNKNDDLKYNSQSKLEFKNIPNEIVIKIAPFINMNNKKELFITMHKANIIHSYIAENSKSDSNSYTINRQDPQISKYINQLSNYNDFFKNFFKNTQVISFGRIDINTKKVIICNELFEDLIKYDKFKERYIQLIEEIVSEYQSNGIEKEDNLYIYDVIYTDKVTKIIYTYGDHIVDIMLIENYFSEYLSNHSMKLLRRIYDTSDRPIIIVNKKALILSYNKIFNNMYINKKQIKDDDNSLSLLDFVPESDKNKVKRAISDTIKFNSYNLKDTITLTNINNDKHECKIQCLKTYGKIDQEKFITITFFPIKKKESKLK